MHDRTIDPRNLSPDHRSALEGADRLAGQGDLAAAIATLTVANRREPSHAVERRVAELRNQHAESVLGADAPSGPPPRPTGEFDFDAVPEVDRIDLDADRLTEAVREHGVLLVRGLVDEPDRRRLIDGIDHTIEAHDEFFRDPRNASTDEWFDPYPAPPATSEIRPWARQGGAVMLADSPRVYFDTIDILTSVGIPAVARAYLGAEPIMTMTKSAMRRIYEGDGICWHQDGAFLGADHRALNLWTSLTPAGPGIAPGLQLVGRRFREVLLTGDGDAPYGWAVDPGLPGRLGAPIIEPAFDAGDALLFDQLLLHRTAPGGDTTHPRYGTESWFFGAGSVPEHEEIPLSCSP